mgnify:CR=1 FL=1
MGMEEIKKKIKEEKPNKKVQELLMRAVNYQKNNRLEDLEKVLKEITVADPNYFPAFFNLGKLLEIKKEYEEAIEFYKKSLKINPNHLDSTLNLINCYEDINNLDQAVKVSEDSCKLHPKRYEVYYNTGRLYHKYKINLDSAYSAFKKSLSINNNLKIAKLGLGQICKSKGNFLEAKKIFQEIIDSGGNEIIPYYEIIDFLDDKEIKKNIKNLKILKNDKEKTDKNKIFLYFAMGKMYEKVSNYNKAFHYFDLGNKLKNKSFGSIDFKWEEKKFEALKKTLKKFGANETKSLGYPSSKPIFIVGMPRSGSTLIEQIISAHSEVFGGGELSHITNFFEKVDTSKKNKNLINFLDHINEKNFFNIGNEYVKEIEKISKKKYFTNKNLGNVFNILLIKLALPNAKIIHCKRNALDTCLSCYKTNFAESNEYTYSLEGLGTMYLMYKEQIEYWDKIFKKQILNVKYEDVIADTKKEAKKILDYLDLNFEENCLEFYKNKRPVYTASVVQARKPIYKGSVNSWENYKNFLKPLANKLNV